MEIFGAVGDGKVLYPNLAVCNGDSRRGYVPGGIVQDQRTLVQRDFRTQFGRPFFLFFFDEECGGGEVCFKQAFFVVGPADLRLYPVVFGIGFQVKAFLVFLFSVFTILYNTVTGAKECKKEYLKVAKVFKANRFQTVFLVIIPAALPSIFNGLKLAAATALTGVLFSEMQSARAGLGYLLTESQNLLNTPRMFFLIILITLLSVGAVKLIDAIEYAISYRWRHV